MATAPTSNKSAILKTGDRMDQPTFHALYERTPSGFKAELIEGTVYVSCPVGNDHSEFHHEVIYWLGTYRHRTPGTIANVDGTMILGPKDEPQPDAVLRIRPDHGGRTHRRGSIIAGPPELAIEIAFSTGDVDLKSKFRSYEAAGILEYLVVDLEADRILWWTLRDGRYDPLRLGPDGLLRSVVFPGLWLDPAALLRLDTDAQIDAVTLGLATPEHAAFVARLAVAGPV